MTDKVNNEKLENVAGGAKKATGRYTFHKVQPGETLGSIARDYNVSQSTIISLNGIKNPDLIYPGQSLKIPLYE